MTPFERAVVIEKPMDFTAEAASLGIKPEEVERAYQDMIDNDEVYLNDTYQVAVRRYPEKDNAPPIIHLSVKRIDKAPVHDWRDMQQIKNELTDPQFEGVELFPAEERLVDTANQYHIWVFADATIRLPIGFPGRLVHYADGVNGSKQRPK